MSQDPDEQPSPGISFFAEMAKAMSSKGPVQWDVARQFAMMTATNSTSEANVDPAVRISVQQLAAVADMHVRDVTGLTTSNTMKVPEIDVVNRSMWVHHTLEAYKPLFTEFATSIYGQTLINPNTVALEGTPDLSTDVPNELNEMISNLTKMMAPAMLGMSVGSMIGQLALRAFGQYDLPLPRDPATQLLFVARNCEEFARDWSINISEMQMWLLVQELTFHAVFKVPHIREVITVAVKNHVASFRPNPDALADRLGTMDITSSDPAALMQRLLTDPTLLIGAVRSPGQEALAPILDAMISSVVSYVDHIVDTVADRILGTGDQIAEAVRRRRVEAGDQDQFVEQLLGLHLTTFQIDRGHQFIAGVIERAGTEGLTGLWTRAGNLPTPNEIVAPGLWLERINY